MKKDYKEKRHMELDRKFLKRLWNNEEVLCPKCNKGVLIPLHKKRSRKNNDHDDWICPNCNEIYRTLNILNDLLN